MNTSKFLGTIKSTLYIFLTVIACTSWCGDDNALSSFELQQSNAVKQYQIAQSILHKVHDQAKKLNTPTNTRVPTIEQAQKSLGALRPRILFANTKNAPINNQNNAPYKENTDPQKALNFVCDLVDDIANKVQFSAPQEERDQAIEDARTLRTYYQNSPYLVALAHKNDARPGSIVRSLSTTAPITTSTTSTAIALPTSLQTSAKEDNDFVPFTQYFSPSPPQESNNIHTHSSQPTSQGTKRTREKNEESDDSDVEEIKPPETKRNPAKSRGQKAAQTKKENDRAKAAVGTALITNFLTQQNQ